MARKSESHAELERINIAGYRYGFMIADMVLGRHPDTSSPRGGPTRMRSQVALQQHRAAYEGYVKKLHEYLKPVMPQA